MPKRTNPFQYLVAFIEKELGGNDAIVRESVMLNEHGTGDEREADVLIEAAVNGHPVKIAIECRDHKRTQTKTWIDCLVGKYADLPVDKVVAVSKSGFSAGAIEKAKRHNIRTLTFEEALDHDWPEEFERFYVKFVAQGVVNLTVAIDYVGDDKPSEKDLKACEIIASDGTSDGSLEDVVMRLYETDARPAAERFLRDAVPKKFTTPEDREEIVEVPYVVTDRFLVDRSGKPHQIEQITLKLRYQFQFLDARQQNYVYNRTQVSIASIDMPEKEAELSIALVQFPESFKERFKLAYQLFNIQKKTGSERRM